MKRFITIFFLLSSLGCGSVFIEHPGEHPDFEYCNELTKDLWGVTPKTPAKLPFSGVRDTWLFTEKPEHWEEFDGSIHLTEITWDVDWMSNASIVVGGLTAAVLEDYGWRTLPNVDLAPAIDVTGNGFLRFHAKIKADGWKPAGEQTIRSTVTVQLCGYNSELIQLD